MIVEDRVVVLDDDDVRLTAEYNSFIDAMDGSISSDSETIGERSALSLASGAAPWSELV